MKLEYKNVFNKGLRKWNRVLFFFGFQALAFGRLYKIT